MPAYQITFARSARKELQALPLLIVRRILAKIERLVANPRAPGCKKLEGPTRLWRLRVGEYRVVYQIDHANRTRHEGVAKPGRPRHANGTSKRVYAL